jgi:hypothetical protein
MGAMAMVVVAKSVGGAGGGGAGGAGEEGRVRARTGTLSPVRSDLALCDATPDHNTLALPYRCPRRCIEHSQIIHISSLFKTLEILNNAARPRSFTSYDRNDRRSFRFWRLEVRSVLR